MKIADAAWRPCSVGVFACVARCQETDIVSTCILRRRRLRIRGYSLLWRRAKPEQRKHIELARVAWLTKPGRIVPLDTAIAVVAGELMTLLPEPPTALRRSHRLTESRQERLSRLATSNPSAAPLKRPPNGFPISVLSS